jgi:uncharacterized protein (TIGR03435 family)
MLRKCRWLLVLLLSSAAWAQARMEFDVASIRQNKAGFPPSGPMPTSNFPLGPGAMYSENGGVFSATNEPLFVYMMFAYKMTDHEVQALQKQLPAWALEEHYDIQAKTEKHDATKDEMRLMMQALLADRLKLVVHRTTEEVPVFALQLAKPGKLGPKLRAHPDDGPPCSNALPQASAGPIPPTVEGAFPLICGGLAGLPPSAPGLLALGYRNVSLELLALQMSGIGGLDRPVVDRTGLTGKYDFAIEFARNFGPDSPPTAGGNSAAPEPTGPTFQQALAEQAGLKLVTAKGPVEVMIVDHIERPSAN